MSVQHTEFNLVISFKLSVPWVQTSSEALQGQEYEDSVCTAVGGLVREVFRKQLTRDWGLGIQGPSSTSTTTTYPPTFSTTVTWYTPTAQTDYTTAPAVGEVCGYNSVKISSEKPCSNKNREYPTVRRLGAL